MPINFKVCQKNLKEKLCGQGDYHDDAFVHWYQWLVVDILSTGCSIISEIALDATLYLKTILGGGFMEI